MRFLRGVIAFPCGRRGMITMREPNVERLLINATQPDIEVRFAIINSKGELENAYIEQPGSQEKNNIYKGVIKRIEPSLQAAFVEYDPEQKKRHGFLPFKEVMPACYKNPHLGGPRNTISDVLEEGQEIMVQVDKEARGNKGAALTTDVTLAGTYSVMMPRNPSAGGVSRRIEGEERDELRELLNSLQLDQEIGLIIRTAGVGKSKAELQWDLDILLHLWNAIEHAFNQRPGPFLIHQEGNIITRAIRDYLRQDIEEIIVDNPDVFEKAKRHIEQIRPEFSNKIHLYQDPVPLFSRFKIERQLETAFQNEVRLPSGGSIVIQQTEAMVSIDVNSSRDTKSIHIEQTALNTNREAAIEVARQLRLRDIGGLIVVDFIDMLSMDNQREVVDVFEREIQVDRARVQYGRISKFGLLEISRQRLRPSLVESSQTLCPRCHGQGTIRNIESIGLFILRLLHEEALQENISELVIQLPVSVATFLLNEKRNTIIEIEKQNGIHLQLIPNPHIETPEYKLEKIKEDTGGTKRPSYHGIQKPDIDGHSRRDSRAHSDAEPAVKEFDIPERPAASHRKPGVLTQIWTSLFGASGTSSPEKEATSSHERSINQANENDHRTRKRTRRPSTRSKPQNNPRGNRYGNARHQQDEPLRENRPPMNKPEDKSERSENISELPRSKSKHSSSAAPTEKKQHTRENKSLTPIASAPEVPMLIPETSAAPFIPSLAEPAVKPINIESVIVEKSTEQKTMREPATTEYSKEEEPNGNRAIIEVALDQTPVTTTEEDSTESKSHHSRRRVRGGTSHQRRNTRQPKHYRRGAPKETTAQDSLEASPSQDRQDVTEEK